MAEGFGGVKGGGDDGYFQNIIIILWLTNFNSLLKIVSVSKISTQINNKKVMLLNML